MAFGGILKKVFRTVKLIKRDYDPEIVTIRDIDMPMIYKSMDQDRIIRDIKSELQTYKSLGYRFKDKKQLEEKEYYTFQIGILLNALSNDIDLNIIKVEKYIPEFIYNSTSETIIYQISEIIKRFDIQVSKSISDIVARDEFNWTPIDAGYIFYYLSFYKDLKVTK
ncbi:MAG: hypothetical protein KAJ49_10995 [Arcobacteraceae bacterium]|nr:hypothetical protein [Arcobacteraceae bacterium]